MDTKKPGGPDKLFLAHLESMGTRRVGEWWAARCESEVRMFVNGTLSVLRDQEYEQSVRMKAAYCIQLVAPMMGLQAVTEILDELNQMLRRRKENLEIVLGICLALIPLRRRVEQFAAAHAS